MITRYFDLMLFKSGTAPCINVNQYDQGETWIFTLYGQGGTKYTPSTGAIVALKSDGHLIANAGTVDGQGRVVITETEQMTASAGKAVCELQIDGDTHGTANFYLLVEPSPADGGIASDSDLSLFQEAIDAVSTIETLLDGEDPNQVIETAVDAWLDDHPEATTTVQDGAITIPKLNDSVLDLLIAESASGNPVVISDGAKNVPVKDLTASITPVQNLNGYSYPWVGGAGKNKLNTKLYNGATYNPNVGDTWTLTESADVLTTTDNKTFTITFASAWASRCLLYELTDDTVYRKIGISASTLGRTVAFLDENYTILSKSISTETSQTLNGILNPPTGAKYYAIEFTNRGTANVTITITEPQIEIGSTATTYAPYSNICPITGHTEVNVTRTGKNLLNSAFCTNRTNKGITTALNADGSITLTGTPTGNTRYWSATDTLALTLPIGTYTLSPSNVLIEKVGGGYSNGTFTLAEPTTYHNVYFTLTIGTTYNITVYPQLEVGSEATAYEPYSATTKTTSLGTTVYGGTLDLTTGVLTTTHKYVEFDGSVDELWERYNGGSASAYCMRVPASDVAQNLTEVIATASYLQSSTGNATWGNYDAFISGSNSAYIYTGVRTITTVEDWQTHLSNNPLQVVYKLATPTTTQLTAEEITTLLGNNVISASSGSVSVIYRADTKMYVDNEITKAKTIIAGVEAGFTATKNYTTGNLLIVGDDLYKVTANIANGGAITPNTNVTKTTVAEQLIALA